MLETFVEYDKELFLFLNGLGTETWDGFWMFYTTKFNWIPFYAFLLLLMYKKLDRKSFLITVALVALMILFTDQITNAFKYGIKRFRPCHNQEFDGIMRLVKSRCGGRYGFFSGHASNSMAVAVFTGLMLQDKYRYLIFIMLFWAGLMAYSRVYIGVHYPLDIFCGMIFGGLSGLMFYKLSQYLFVKFTSA
ncbi:phosphatase PAP2 family protein [Mangrovimonas aestuarii]|uniref:phosphatase PAP2 family protein n=1 Tax=Mangrovimonas aestuarii TaxID=3018443 RepID=UPI0023791708|nr:phosphatase PAP2 family protein [Mangrovimonas aestuarii]